MKPPATILRQLLIDAGIGYEITQQQEDWQVFAAKSCIEQGAAQSLAWQNERQANGTRAPNETNIRTYLGLYLAYLLWGI